MEFKYNSEKHFEWVWQTATEEERELYFRFIDLSDEYFPDFRFEEGTIAEEYVKVQEQADDGEWLDSFEDAPDVLRYFKDYVLDSFIYKVEKMEDGALGCVSGDYSVTIDPEQMKDDGGKSTILHELIHLYILALANVSQFYHDILLLCLYNDLKGKIADLDNRILSHTHIINGEKITKLGGEHDILFFLKSLDLDFRCGYKLGTVCGYGRDEFGED